MESSDPGLWHSMSEKFAVFLNVFILMFLCYIINFSAYGQTLFNLAFQVYIAILYFRCNDHFNVYVLMVLELKTHNVFSI